jgi:hypothetical protein
MRHVSSCLSELTIVETDLYASRPWAYSPLVATMNEVHITTEETSTNPKYRKLTRLSELSLLKPLDGNQNPPKGPMTQAADRRKWLSSQSVRAGTAFPSTYVAGDFANPFIDFNTFSVTLPYVGLKVDVLKYWMKGDKRQPLRYVCRTRPGLGEETVFWVVMFELVGDAIIRDDSLDEKAEVKEINLNALNEKLGDVPTINIDKSDCVESLGVD